MPSDAEASSDQSEPDREEPSPGPDAGSSAIAETTECPNCGRVFVGDYCPSCGQEARLSVSPIDVVGGFFRELVDVERGFGPTLVGLTLRPGETLRGYLQGGRAGLASPGRYLVAAMILSLGIQQLLGWAGAADVPFDASGLQEARSSAAAGEGPAAFFVETLYTALEQWARLYQEIAVLTALIVAALVAALIYRLFASRKIQPGEALALGCFMSAHVIVLNAGAELIGLLVSFLLTGQPVEGGLFLLALVQVGYVGYASHGCFGGDWQSALKGALAGGWSYVETMGIVILGVVGHAGWLAWDRVEANGLPEMNGGEVAATELGALYLTFAFASALPLLLHLAIEIYYQLS